MSGSVMDNGIPGKLLAAFGTAQVAFRVILHDHVSVTLDERSRALLSVAVEQCGAFSAMHGDCVCLSHDNLLKMTP